jgi:hypothetical protein
MPGRDREFTIRFLIDLYRLIGQLNIILAVDAHYPIVGAASLRQVRSSGIGQKRS